MAIQAWRLGKVVPVVQSEVFQSATKGVVVTSLNEKIESGSKTKLMPEANEHSGMINWHCTIEGSQALKHPLPPA